MIKGTSGNKTWKSGSLTGLIDKGHDQQQQRKRQEEQNQEQLEEICSLAECPDGLENETVGEFFRFTGASDALIRSTAHFRSTTRACSGMGQTASTGESEDLTKTLRARGRSVGEGDAGGTMRHKSAAREKSTAGGEKNHEAKNFADVHEGVKEKESAGATGAKDLYGAGKNVGGNHMKSLLEEFKDAEEIDEDTDLGKYVESRLYQNLKRYPSDFDLPSGDDYDPLEEGEQGEEQKDEDEDDRESSAVAFPKFETPSPSENSKDETYLEETNDAGEEDLILSYVYLDMNDKTLDSIGDELRGVEASLSSVALGEDFNPQARPGEKEEQKEEKLEETSEEEEEVEVEEKSQEKENLEDEEEKEKSREELKVEDKSKEEEVEQIMKEDEVLEAGHVKREDVEKTDERKVKEAWATTVVTNAMPEAIPKTSLSSTAKTPPTPIVKRSRRKMTPLIELETASATSRETSLTMMKKTTTPTTTPTTTTTTTTTKGKSLPLNLDREREVITDAIMRLRRVENRLMRGEESVPPHSFANSSPRARDDPSPPTDRPTDAQKLEEAEKVVDRIHDMCDELRTILHGKSAKKAEEVISGKVVRQDVAAIGKNKNNNRTKGASKAAPEEPLDDKPLRRSKEREKKEKKEEEEEEEEEEKEEEDKFVSAAPASEMRSRTTCSSPIGMGVPVDISRRRSSWSEPDRTTTATTMMTTTTTARSSTADSVVEAWMRDYEAEGLFDYRRYSNLVVRENGKLKMVDEVEDESRRGREDAVFEPTTNQTKESSPANRSNFGPREAAADDAAAAEKAKKMGNVAKIVRPKSRWTAKVHETTTKIEERRDAIRSSAGCARSDDDRDDDDEDDGSGEGRGEREKGPTTESEAESDTGGNESRCDIVALVIRRDGDNDAQTDVESDGDVVDGDDVDGDEDGVGDNVEDDGSEGGVERRKTRRKSPREAKEEERKQAAAQTKRKAKDFTFKSLKHFWDKVEKNSKMT